MAFGGFRETNETNENVDNREATTENSEKRRNQILEVPEDYNDDFESKIDEKENSDKGKEGVGNEDRSNWFERIKFLCSREKNTEKNKEGEETENKEPQKSRAELFHDSIRVTETPEEIMKRNAEAGYPESTTERPKGGFERERTLDGEHPGKYEAMQDNSSDNGEDS